MSIITISHEAFGAGRAIAERAAEILGYRCISREVLIKASVTASQKPSYSRCSKKNRITGGRKCLRAAGFTASRFRQPYASSCNPHQDKLKRSTILDIECKAA